MKSEMKSALSARFIYVYVFFLFLLLTMFADFQMLPLPMFKVPLLVLGLWGGALLVLDFFKNRDMFRNPFVTLLLLFFITIGISSLLNIRYGVAGNIKTLVISAIHFFLLAGSAARAERKQARIQIRILGETLGAVWLFGVLYSLAQFILQYGYDGYGSDGCYLRVGFFENRLFGCFTDPNYAAILSLSVIIYSLWAILRADKRIGGKVYHGANIFLQVIYVILSGSRTALLIFAAITTILPIVFYAFPRWKGKYAILKVAAAAAAIVVSLFVFFSAAEIAKNGLSYLPGLVPNETASSSVDGKTDRADLVREDVGPEKDFSNGRLKMWAAALEIYKEKPIFGTSPRNYVEVGRDLLGVDANILTSQGLSIHNGFLAVLVCTGVVGALLILCWFAGCIFVTLRYLIRHRGSPDEDYWLILMLTVIVLILSLSCVPLMGIFFTNSAMDVIFWSCAGYLLCMVQKNDEMLQEKTTVAERCFNRFFSLFCKGKRTIK